MRIQVTFRGQAAKWWDQHKDSLPQEYPEIWSYLQEVLSGQRNPATSLGHKGVEFIETLQGQVVRMACEFERSNQGPRLVVREIHIIA